ncbi:hypothetical protein B0T16DRAFT_511360 [Cercophora newfieldiana]|uniref:RING-type domain-containing protein n=1 Tax=Cercophora newfieldiana TaxID=92897 RepID=A0AA39Y995_9PEZI|nr:hypothetical protein B0T16DRAFT_511360 [Cercophora newfieldiana]
MPIATLPRRQEECFHLIRQWLRTHSGAEPYAICPICQLAELRIAGISPSPTSTTATATTAADIDNGLQPAIVLPCTHMMCAPCFHTAAMVAAGSARWFACPICREPTTAERCGHSCHVELPGEGKEDAAVGFMMGIRIANDGFGRPEWCPPCLTGNPGLEKGDDTAGGGEECPAADMDGDDEDEDYDDDEDYHSDEDYLSPDDSADDPEEDDFRAVQLSRGWRIVEGTLHMRDFEGEIPGPDGLEFLSPLFNSSGDMDDFWAENDSVDSQDLFGLSRLFDEE